MNQTEYLNFDFDKIWLNQKSKESKPNKNQIMIQKNKSSYMKLLLKQEYYCGWYLSIWKSKVLVFNKQKFQDALRYHIYLVRLPSTSACAKPYGKTHAFSCQRRGFNFSRHNDIRNITDNLFLEVCKDNTRID